MLHCEKPPRSGSYAPDLHFNLAFRIPGPRTLINRSLVLGTCEKKSRFFLLFSKVGPIDNNLHFANCINATKMYY